MAPQSKRAFLRLSVVGFLAAVLVLLAVLQYRWSLEISRAERTRIEASLNTSVNQFRQEFYRELAQVTTAFHSDPQPSREISGRLTRSGIKHGCARLRVPIWWPMFT